MQQSPLVRRYIQIETLTYRKWPFTAPLAVVGVSPDLIINSDIWGSKTSTINHVSAVGQAAGKAAGKAAASVMK